MADEEFRRGTGGDPNQPPLRQGDASAATAALEAVPEEEVEDLAETGDEIDPDIADILEADEEEFDLEMDDEITGQESTPPGYRPTDEMDALIYRKGSGLTRPSRPAAPIGIPLSLVRQLPILGVAAADPNSPPIYRAVYRSLIDRLREAEGLD